jgi:hypothetical protein
MLRSNIRPVKTDILNKVGSRRAIYPAKSVPESGTRRQNIRRSHIQMRYITSCMFRCRLPKPTGGELPKSSTVIAAFLFVGQTARGIGGEGLE